MSCPEFIAESLALGTAARLLHLTSRSYAQHVALGDFYDGLSDLIDQYAEVYIGLAGPVRSFPSVKPPSGEAVDLLDDYLGSIKEELSEDDDSEALKNILTEIEALTARTLYKLRNLK